MLNDQFIWSLTPQARSLYNEYVAEGLDSDLAFELVVALLPEEEVYKLEEDE